jgi:methyl-accepting chemotaxis protein
MVEESNAASSSLETEAVKLRDLVARFQLSGAGARYAAPRATPASASQEHKPAFSPARKLMSKIAGSFGSAAVAQPNWEEF